MTDPDLARGLLREIDAWEDEGLVSAETADALRARYREDAARSTPADGGTRGAGWSTAGLYGTAAVLLGAAAIALVMLGLDPAEPGLPLVAAAGLLAAAGAAVHRGVPGRTALGDAVLASSMAPATAAAFPGQGLDLAVPVALGLPVALLAWRPRTRFVAVLAAVAFSVTAGASAFHLFETDGLQAAWWTGLMVVAVAGLVLQERLVLGEDRLTVVPVAVVGAAVSLVFLLADPLDLGSSEAVELALGALMAGVLAVGWLLRHRGLVAGAGTVLAVDAIVFAFDAGNVVTGVGLLLALAALLVWQAETVRDALG